jgi:hypothetical protein
VVYQFWVTLDRLIVCVRVLCNYDNHLELYLSLVTPYYSNQFESYLSLVTPYHSITNLVLNLAFRHPSFQHETKRADSSVNRLWASYLRTEISSLASYSPPPHVPSNILHVHNVSRLYQGCYGLQKQFSKCKIADTIPRNLKMGSWLQNFRSAFGREADAANSCFLAL